MKGRTDVRRGARSAERPSDRGWVYGPHVVEHWLARDAGLRLRRIYYDAAAARRLGSILEGARRVGVSVESRDRSWLTQAVRSEHHHGVVAEAQPFPYASLEDVLAQRPELVLVVDQVQDPRNLGAILRSAAAAGAGAVVLPRDGTVGVTATVESAAVGAAALLPVLQVVNLARNLATWKEAGYWVLGLDARGEANLFGAAALPTPAVLVVGGERGIRPLVQASCDRAVFIPMANEVESLNVSVAAALALFELRRRIEAEK